jgi:inorganic phosphate transporter, PiT family
VNTVFLSVVGLVALALLFDFSNGFHDAANSIATVVATRTLPPRWAVAFSAFFNFAAFFVVGGAVANTVAKVVHADYVTVSVVMAALVSAVTWNYLTWWVGMPSSSSHALIGGLVGAGLSAGWQHAVDWSAVDKAMVAIIASPLVAFTISFLAMFAVRALQWLTRWSDSAKPFKGLQLVSAAAVSFGHGANDAQKTMGVIAALLLGTGYTTAGPSGAIPLPRWVALAAYSAIALGTLWGGWKIIETMGLRLTRLHASSAVAANIGAASAIFGATGYGIPVSTTHAAASSVMGAGVSSGAGLRVRVVLEMTMAWVVTIPTTVLIGFAVHRLTLIQPHWLAVGAVGSLLFVVGGFILYATLHTVSARQLAEELPTPDELTEPLPARPHLASAAS